MKIIARAGESRSFVALLESSRNHVRRFPTVIAAMRNATGGMLDRLACVRATRVTHLDINQGRLGVLAPGWQALSAAAPFECTPGGEQGVVLFDERSVAAIVWAAYGGSEAGAPARPPGPIRACELSVLDHVSKAIVEGIGASLRDFLTAAKMRLEPVKPIAAFATSLTTPLECFAARFTIGLASPTAEVIVVLPCSQFADLRDVLAPNAAQQGDGAQAEKRRGNGDRGVSAWIGQAPVEVAAVLGELSLPLEYVSGLKAGDLLELDTASEGAIVLESGGVQLARCTVGKLGGRLAVRIEARVEKGAKIASHALAEQIAATNKDKIARVGVHG